MNFGSADLWRDRIAQRAIAESGFYFSFAMVPAAPNLEPLRVSRSNHTITVELLLASDWPGCALYCRIDGSLQDSVGLRQHVHHDRNHRHSAWVVAAMVLLLALCGFICGGTDGAHRAVVDAMRQPDKSTAPHQNLFRQLGARLLHPSDMPDLFRVLAELCRRAQLSRLPDLYYVAAPAQMNAYACGDPDNVAIIVTEGLLRNMSLDEIAGILAHEIAHIRNHDAWAMDWAAALNRAIAWVSLAGIATSHARAERPLVSLLHAAPAIGRLLFLALSRIRELDADATALELTGDTRAMVGALAKLEQHHTGSAVVMTAAFEQSPMRFLRSHPETSERVGTLLNLAQ